VRRAPRSSEASWPRRWGVGSERAVDFAVCRLRRKLERDPGEPRILQTVHGRGYRLALRGVYLDFGAVHLLGDELPLSPAQRLLLALLREAAEQPVAREALARALRRSCRTGAVERLVAELRALVEPVPSEPSFLLDAEGATGSPCTGPPTTWGRCDR
jgi:DNA-binding response OmpR family regulator